MKLINPFTAKLRKSAWNSIGYNLASGISYSSIIQTLELNSKVMGRKSLAKMYNDIYKKIEQGFGVAESLELYIPEDEFLLIAAGEHSNNISKGFDLAIELLESKGKIRSILTSSLAYPVFLGMFVVGILYFISTTIIPTMAQLVDVNQWTGAAWLLLHVSNFIQSWGIVLLIAIVVMLILFTLSLPRLTGKTRVILDRHIPYSMYRLSVGAAWLLSISSLLSINMKVSDICQNMNNNKRTTAYLKERNKALLRFQHLDFVKALESTGYEFPDKELLINLSMYSNLPDFEDKLSSFTRFWLKENLENMAAQGRILSTLFMIMIGATIIMILLAIFAIQTSITT